MSGPIETGKVAAPASQNAARKSPGRTLGFTLMTLMILFAGYWLQRQSQSTLMNASDTTVAEPAAVAGLDSERWYLPADEMLGFIRIPAGSFTMGSNPAQDNMAYENERWSSVRRQGSVELPDYFIGRFEVTTAQFNAFRRATGTGQAAAATARPGTHPVSEITWAEALAYSRWLEQQLRASDRTPAQLKEILEAGAHVTLPSEAEWEKAARGTDGRIFPWGSEPSSQFANFGGNEIAPVGSRDCPNCSYGVADMSGNVWEFTRSPLQDYPFDPADDFRQLDSDPIYVMRGGSYADTVNNVRAATRGGVDPGVRSPTIGFRLAISSL